MSWPLAAFAILAAALAGGFAWYERTRPDARIIALVGTLAAFAALGRIAFAAVPNVKPTTDIVLISGYALGGGPGFAVGALAGLTSNFFFGQGPWTAWQMAAWGATGVIGAGLALLTRRSIRRWPLAVMCGVVGFAFTAMQDVGDWVTYSDHSVTQLGLYVGQGLGFDAIHAGGCVAFALAFGPALARSLERFARRLQVHWVPLDPARAAPPLLALALALSVSAALAAPGRARAADPATSGPVAYLLRAQNPDGGFGPAAGQPSAGLYTGWAALGLAATGHPPLQLARAGHGVIGYLQAGGAPSADVGALERTILVTRAAGLSPRSFGGHDLLAALERRSRPDGSTAEQVNLTAFAILALRAAGVTPGRRTYAWLGAQQNQDGGFGFATRGASSDVDDTGAVLEALAGAPGAASARARAVGYLRGQQARDGGFPAQSGAVSNAQSTAWAVQGLDAAGVAPSSLRRHRAPSPLAYLSSLIAPDGSVRYARGLAQTPVWVTGEALMALAGRPLPLAPVPVPPAPVAAARSHSVPASRSRSVAPARPSQPAARRPPAAGHAVRPAASDHAPAGPPLSAAERASAARLAAGAGLLAALALAPLGL